METLQNRMEGTFTIQKEKRTFLYQQRAFTIEKYLNTAEKIAILRTEVINNELNIEKEIPSFIKIGKEITNERNYSSWNLARREN